MTPEEQPSRSRFGKLSRAYKAAALITFTTALLFVAVNLLSVPVLMLLPKPQSVVVEKYGRAEIERIHSHLPPAEVTRLLEESWSKGVIYEPYVHFREAPRSGLYDNVHEAGFRHSARQCAWPPDPAHFNVFVFGGSTTFGYGVADDETVPSRLGEQLSQALGVRVCVYNFGRCYYQSVQERILFEHLLLQGHVPRLALFIDGLNDCHYPDGAPPRDTRIEAAMLGVDAAQVEPAAGTRLPATLLLRRLLNHKPENNQRAMDATGSETTGGNVKAEAQAVSLRYVKNMGMINRLAASYGVETWFVWQPVPTYKYDTQHHLFASGIGAHWRSKVIYEHMAEMRGVLPFPKNFLWCADIQENLKEPLYVDAVHYTRDMSRRLATEITSQMLARRHQAAPAGQGR